MEGREVDLPETIPIKRLILPSPEVIICPRFDEPLLLHAKLRISLVLVQLLYRQQQSL